MAAVGNEPMDIGIGDVFFFWTWQVVLPFPGGKVQFIQPRILRADKKVTVLVRTYFVHQVTAQAIRIGPGKVFLELIVFAREIIDPAKKGADPGIALFVFTEGEDHVVGYAI